MRPGRWLLHALGAWFALGLAASFAPGLGAAWALAGLALAAAAALDAVLARRGPSLRCVRRVERSLPVDERSPVVLSLSVGGTRAVEIEVHDHHPDSADVDGMPRRVRVAPGAATETTYVVIPRRRGEARFGTCEARTRSPLGLWDVRRRIGAAETVRVFPDFRRASRWALLATDNARSLVGVRKRPLRGDGLELRQLREWREGDALRQVDWKATSRLRRPISREYQAERDQQVVILLDCGRAMRARDEARSHFDQALDAVLLLAYVALRQGDAVGVLAFGGRTRWLPPVRGAGAMPVFLEAVYDLEPTPEEPDYAAAVSDLMVRQRRRALVVLVSNLQDEGGGEIAAAVRTIRRRHLVLLASLREGILDAALERPVRGLGDALRAGSALAYLEARSRAHRSFEARGVSVLDVRPAELPPALVNRYLDVKRSGAL